MVIITNLAGESLPLRNIDVLSRTRGTNGEYYLKLVTHRSDKNKETFDYIEEYSIITLPDGNTFRVRNRDKQSADDTVRIEVTALHTLYDRRGNQQEKIIEGERVLTLHQALSHAFEGTDITFYIEDEFDNHSFENFGNDNTIVLFNEIKEKFEFEFEIENNTHLRIYKQLGKENNTQLRYRHNIKTLKLEDDTHNLATYIKGKFGDELEDDEGNSIPDTYSSETDYTSPNVEKYGLIKADTYKNNKIKHESTMQRYLKSKLTDEAEMTLTVEHQILMNNITKQLDDIELGDTLYLIHEPMNIQFQIRVNQIIDFPLHPQIKPIYTLSTNPKSLIDSYTLPYVEKANNDKAISNIKNNQSELTNRLEQAQQAVDDVHNAMKDVDAEMDRLENEVIPEIEQAVESSKIPSQVDPPYPIPTSKLWWDTSQNPPVLMRYDGSNWVVLAVTEEDIDALMQQMRDEAIQQGITYTDAQIQAARDNIIEQLDNEIGDVNSNIDDLTNMKDELADRVDTAEQEIIQRVSKTEYQSDKTDILSSIESNESSITQLSDEVELRVTKEEFDNLEIGGTNLIIIEQLLGDRNFNASTGELQYTNNAVATDYQIPIGNHTKMTASRKPGTLNQQLDNERFDFLRAVYLDEENEVVSIQEHGEKTPPLTFDVPSSSKYVRFSSSRGDLRNIKIEFGNKPTSFSPAPEDALERITKTEATLTIHADSIEQKAEKSELINFVDKQEYTEKVGSLTTSIDGITGTVQDIEADVDKNTGDITRASSKIGDLEITADDITSTVSRLGADVDTANEAISSVKQTADGIVSTVSGVRTDLDDVEAGMKANKSSIEQLPDQINLAVTEGIEDLEIGGRNLLVQGEFLFNTALGSDNGIPTNTNNANTTHFIEVEGSKSITSSRKIGTVNGVNEEIHFDYFRWAFYKKDKSLILVDDTGASGVNPPLTIVVPNNAHYARFSSSRGDLYNLKVEFGNKATDWTPAPEDGVNKTNVLSSINLSTEGVKIQGTKIDIQGLVSVLNADGSTGTMIDGGKIVGQSVTANKLNVNNIFGNSAVIAKIQADSVKTAKLSASNIDTGTLNAARIGALSITSAKIAAGAITTQKITTAGLNASVIKTGTLDASNVLIHGGNTTDYTLIDGSFLESRGRYTRTWRGNTKTHDIKLRHENGYLRARNDSEDRSLYFSDNGLSTAIDGSLNDSASGTLEFFDTQFSTARGVTLHSHFGVVALQSNNNRVITDAYLSNNIESSQSSVYIRPQRNVRSGNNVFQFYVKDNASVAETDGVIYYGSDENDVGAGLRFSKQSRKGEIHATNHTGDKSSGTFHAQGFYGELRPNGAYNYIRAERTRFVAPGSSTTSYSTIQFKDGMSESIRTTSTNFYIGTSTGEVRVTNNLLHNGGDIGYRPIKASSFVESSSIKSKENIKTFTESALNVVTNLDVVEYNYKDDEPKHSPFRSTAKKERYIGFIAENSNPISSDDGEGVDLGKVLGYNTKAIQELAEENDELRNRIEQLEQLLA